MKNNKQKSKTNPIVYIISMALISIIWIIPGVSIGYTMIPLETLLIVLLALLTTAVMFYKIDNNKTLNNKTIAIIAIVSLGPIIPIHYTSGIQSSTHLNESIIKTTNGITNNTNLLSAEKSISYNNTCQNEKQYMAVDTPSNATLSTGPATFTPISIIKETGWTHYITNWIYDKRKISIKVTQQSHQFPMIVNVADWISFRDSAISPNIAENEYNAQQEKNQQHDAKLKATISQGQPL